MKPSKELYSISHLWKRDMLVPWEGNPAHPFQRHNFPRQKSRWASETQADGGPALPTCQGQVRKRGIDLFVVDDLNWWPCSFIEVCQPQKDLGILTINARTGSQRKARKIAKVKGTLGAKPRTVGRYFAPPTSARWTWKRKVSSQLGSEPKLSASSTESIPTQEGAADTNKVITNVITHFPKSKMLLHFLRLTEVSALRTMLQCMRRSEPRLASDRVNT